jgi:hypothetical protein
LILEFDLLDNELEKRFAPILKKERIITFGALPKNRTNKGILDYDFVFYNLTVKRLFQFHLNLKNLQKDLIA